MITYGGLTLSHPTDEVLARWDRWRDRHTEEPVAPRGFAAPGLDHLPRPAWADHLYRRPRLNTLVWPTGASRWAQFQCLATKRQLEAVQAAVGDAGTPLELVIGTTANGGRRVSTAMHLLTPRVVFDGYSLDKPLYLLTLVDARWFWWQETSATAPAVTSWSALIGGLLSAVGVSPTVDTIHADYSTPQSARWAGLTHKPLPVLIDAAAESVGCRVVRQTDGTVVVASASSCRTREDSNWASYRDRLEVGGRADVAAFGPGLPEAVTVLFGGGAATAAVALSATGVFTGTTVAGVSGRVGVVHADLAATAAGAARTALAAVAAADWYRLALSRVDAVFGGVCRWEPTGLEERVEYEWLPACEEYPDGRALTRVVPAPQWDRNRYGGGPAARGVYAGQFYPGTPFDAQRVLSDLGAWEDSAWPGGYRPYTPGLVPIEIGAGVPFTAKNTATILAWPEPALPGRLAYLPIQYADETYAGYLSSSTQNIGGAKTFHADVTVGLTGAGRTLTVYGDLDVVGSNIFGNPLYGLGNGTFTGNVNADGYISSATDMGAPECSFGVTDAGFSVDGPAGAGGGWTYSWWGAADAHVHVRARVIPDPVFSGIYRYMLQFDSSSTTMGGLYRLQTGYLDVTNDALFANPVTISDLRVASYRAKRLVGEYGYEPPPITVGADKYDVGGTLSKTESGTTYMLFSKGIYVGGTGAAGTPTVLTGTAGSGGSSDLDSVLTGMGGVTGTFNSGAF